jgi:flagellar FliL protein
MAKKAKVKKEEQAQDGAAGEGAKAGLVAKLTADKKKLAIFGGGGLVVLLALGVGGAWALGMFKPKPPPQSPQQQTAQGQPSEPAPRARLPHFMDLPDMTVNLTTSNQQRQQFLRLKIALELAEQSVAAQIQPVMPRILDAFQTYLREMRPSDVEGSTAVHRLKEELTRRVNLAVQPARVEAVLFREILVQ